MADTLLITLGCSWTYGVGCNYQPGMTRKEYEVECWDNKHADQWAWRAVLCQAHGWHNFNLAEGGSSNQRQMRYAETFFSSAEFDRMRKRYRRIIVFWGITSTARNEFFSIDENYPVNFLFDVGDTEPAKTFTKFCVKYTHSHNYEVYRIKRAMLHWNRYFRALGVQNYWFDTFNHHDYHEPRAGWFNKCSRILPNDYADVAGPDWPTFEDFSRRNFEGIQPEILDEIFGMFPDHVAWQIDLPVNPMFNEPIENIIGYHDHLRDQLSWLSRRAGIEPTGDGYHRSLWRADTPITDGLTSIGWLNPISCHPTRETHQLLANYFREHLPYLFDK